MKTTKALCTLLTTIVTVGLATQAHAVGTRSFKLSDDKSFDGGEQVRQTAPTAPHHTRGAHTLVPSHTLARRVGAAAVERLQVVCRPAVL